MGLSGPELSDLSPPLRALVAESLEEGEDLLWLGRPRAGRWVALAAPYALLGAGLIAMACAAGWTAIRLWDSIPDSTLLFFLLGLPLMALFLVALAASVAGILLLTLPIRAALMARRTAYLATSRRALTLMAERDPTVYSFGPERLKGLEFIPRIGHEGDILFGPAPAGEGEVARLWRPRSRPLRLEDAFIAVPEAGRVADLLRQVARDASHAALPVEPAQEPQTHPYQALLLRKKRRAAAALSIIGGLHCAVVVASALLALTPAGPKLMEAMGRWWDDPVGVWWGVNFLAVFVLVVWGASALRRGPSAPSPQGTRQAAFHHAPRWLKCVVAAGIASAVILFVAVVPKLFRELGGPDRRAGKYYFVRDNDDSFSIRNMDSVQFQKLIKRGIVREITKEQFWRYQSDVVALFSAGLIFFYLVLLGLAYPTLADLRAKGAELAEVTP